jgi:hypothetical protein
MARIEFDEDLYNNQGAQNNLLVGSATPFSVRLLIKYGIVQNKQQALYVLIGVLVFVIAATWWVMGGLNGSNSVDYVTAPDGTVYSADEFVELIKQGKDPLNP